MFAINRLQGWIVDIILKELLRFRFGFKFSFGVGFIAGSGVAMLANQVNLVACTMYMPFALVNPMYILLATTDLTWPCMLDKRISCTYS